MKKINPRLKLLLLSAATAFVFAACQDKAPNDPSDEKENISNDRGESYGAKGDDRPEPSQPGESTTGATTGDLDTAAHRDNRKK